MSRDSTASSATEMLSDEDAAAIQAKAAQMMAEREAAEKSAASQKTEGKTSSSSIFPILIGVVVLLAVGVGAYLMMGR